MKKTLIFLLLCLLCVPSSGWGRLGHAAIAEIAERHLTKKAKENIERYTGGTHLWEYSHWMDDVVKTPPYDVKLAGWHASVCTPDCVCSPAVRLEVRGLRDGVSAMEFWRECLADRKDVPDSTVLLGIKCIIHIIGDFHCPAHVRFSDNVNDLKYPVSFFGKPMDTLHRVWDFKLIERGSGFVFDNFREYATRLDTWNKRQIRMATKGWAREWFEDCARDVRPIVGTVPEGAALGQEFVDGNIGLAELELRKAGYQLAKALNIIFGK